MEGDEHEEADRSLCNVIGFDLFAYASVSRPEDFFFAGGGGIQGDLWCSMI